ncbi:MAG: LysR family transcriptional regulator, partial [Myxococcota bacterium]
MTPISWGWEDKRVLFVLDETGSLREAARRLDVHASTISRRLEAAEARFGHPLVDRSTQPIRFEPAGRHLLAAARDMAEAHLQAVDRASEAADGMSGRLTVGLPGA